MIQVVNGDRPLVVIELTNFIASIKNIPHDALFLMALTLRRKGSGVYTIFLSGHMLWIFNHRFGRFQKASSPLYISPSLQYLNLLSLVDYICISRAVKGLVGLELAISKNWFKAFKWCWDPSSTLTDGSKQPENWNVENPKSICRWVGLFLDNSAVTRFISTIK